MTGSLSCPERPAVVGRCRLWKPRERVCSRPLWCALLVSRRHAAHDCDDDPRGATRLGSLVPLHGLLVQDGTLGPAAYGQAVRRVVTWRPGPAALAAFPTSRRWRVQARSVSCPRTAVAICSPPRSSVASPGRRRTALGSSPSFRWDDGQLIFRTSPYGVLAQLGRRQPVAFEVDDVDPVSRTAWSVVVHGEAGGLKQSPRLLDLGAGRGRNVGHRQPALIAIDPVTITGRYIRGLGVKRDYRCATSSYLIGVDSSGGNGRLRCWASHEGRNRRRSGDLDAPASR